jgi:hypothetical protein
MKKKRKRIIKQEIREKIFDLKKQTKICHNLRALQKFTRLQTKRTGAFKERSASTQHKLLTSHRIHNSTAIPQFAKRNNNRPSLPFDSSFEHFNPSLLKNFTENRRISARKYSNFHPIENSLKRSKKRHLKSSSSTHSVNLPAEFYLEYFRMLKSVYPNVLNKEKDDQTD